jgi:hypothetical protein
MWAAAQQAVQRGELRRAPRALECPRELLSGNSRWSREDQNPPQTTSAAEMSSPDEPLSPPGIFIFGKDEERAKIKCATHGSKGLGLHRCTTPSTQRNACCAARPVAHTRVAPFRSPLWPGYGSLAHTPGGPPQGAPFPVWAGAFCPPALRWLYVGTLPPHPTPRCRKRPAPPTQHCLFLRRRLPIRAPRGGLHRRLAARLVAGQHGPQGHARGARQVPSCAAQQGVVRLQRCRIFRAEDGLTRSCMQSRACLWSGSRPGRSPAASVRHRLARHSNPSQSGDSSPRPPPPLQGPSR